MKGLSEMREYWHLTVFGSDLALGNPTGIIFLELPLPEAEYRHLAAALGNPDTMFLWPGRQADEWETRTFSPAEEMSFCVQALIAADHVLRLKRPALGGSDLYLRTAVRRVAVGRLPDAPHDVGWVKLPYEEIRLLGEREPLSSLFRLAACDGYPQMVIDGGRRRVYQRLADEAALRRVALRPEDVMEYCRGADVNGVCLFALTGEAEIALRVFTTSLEGREDASTGGAVSGLLTYLERQDAALGARRVRWTIQQGGGPPHGRGTLLLRYEEPGMVAVGGRARLVLRGQLTDARAEG